MKILTLRLFKVAEHEISYNKDLSIKSENQLYKVSYGTLDWEAFKKNIGYTFKHAEIVELNNQVKSINEVEVLGKKTPTADFKYNKIEVTAEIKAEVSSIFKAPSAKLTPEQIKIAELEAKLNLLTKSSPEKTNTQTGSNEELEAARAKYEELFGKKPSHLTKLETLINKITNFKPAE